MFITSLSVMQPVGGRGLNPRLSSYKPATGRPTPPPPAQAEAGTTPLICAGPKQSQHGARCGGNQQILMQTLTC